MTFEPEVFMLSKFSQMDFKSTFSYFFPAVLTVVCFVTEILTDHQTTQLEHHLEIAVFSFDSL